MRSFMIEVRGHPYRGLWREEPGGRVQVRTDLGSVWRNLEGREPGVVAREVLQTLAPPLQRFGRTG